LNYLTTMKTNNIFVLLYYKFDYMFQTISLRLPKTTAQKLKRAAKLRKKTMSDYLRDLISNEQEKNITTKTNHPLLESFSKVTYDQDPEMDEIWAEIARNRKNTKMRPVDL
jgi:hypothetical protein